jgi:hypothetical protein
MIRFYIAPIEQVGDYRGPEYFLWRYDADPLNSVDCRWSLKDYGSQINTGVLAADIEIDDHAYVSSQADVFSFPENIDVNPSPAELSALEDFMEIAYIPADWLLPNMSWREVIRTITGMFLFMQRLTAITGDSPLDWGITLNTSFGDIPTDKQDAIIEAYDSLGYDSSVLKDNWTLRIILKNTADQWGDAPIYFGFVTL